MKNAVMYGAGNIGRGFIGKVFYESGLSVVFVDVVQEVIDKLKQGRQVQVHYMDELNKALPSQIWVNYYKQSGETLILRGNSLSTDGIAGFMRNLEASVYFKDIRLDQTSQKEVSLAGRKVRVNDFSIRLAVVPGAGA